MVHKQEYNIILLNLKFTQQCNPVSELFRSDINITPNCVYNLIGTNECLFFFLFVLISSHGANERISRCPQVHKQCRKAWQTSGITSAMLKGNHQIPYRDDEARLHWRIRNCRRSSFRQSRCQFDRPIKQMWRHFTPL